MTRHSPVQPEELFAAAKCVRVDDAVPDVVGEGPEIRSVVVEPLELEQQGTEILAGPWYFDAERVFEREAVREVVADGRVSRDSLGKLDAVRVMASFEELLDALVDEPEPRFHRDDRLSHDGESEVAGLDETGVDGTDRDLVDARPADFDEREGIARLVDRWRRSCVVAERMPIVGPVLVVHETAKEGVTRRRDPEQVGELAFESAGRERQRRQARNRRCRTVGTYDELDAGVGAGLDEQVHDTKFRFVVVAGNERESVAVGRRAWRSARRARRRQRRGCCVGAGSCRHRSRRRVEEILERPDRHPDDRERDKAGNERTPSRRARARRSRR